MIFTALAARRSPILRELRFVRDLEMRSAAEIRRLQEQRLERLIRHAFSNTEYYRDVLTRCGVVHSGAVDLAQFREVPFLTKEILRRQGDRLRAQNLPRGVVPYRNRTGGSTGQPCEFWQDSYYDAVNTADKLYHFGTLGKRAGEAEMKIWGAQRDLFKDTGRWHAKAINFLYHRRIETCATLSNTRIEQIIGAMNRFRPRLIWGYVDGLYAIAEHARRKSLRIPPPAAVFCGGGTLFPPAVEAIEEAFGCPAINYYGSREMGAVACQCRERRGLHITSHSHVVEVVDDKGRNAGTEEGHLVITSLTNYAMPFLRYWIGDRGKMGTEACPCGRGFPLLATVSGRAMESLIKPTGELVSPIYLVTILGTRIDTALVERFQVIQEETTRVVLNVVANREASPGASQAHVAEVTNLLRQIMECDVRYEFVADIPRSPSGKYMYTLCRVPRVCHVAADAAWGLKDENN